jgi:hypothetical protein
MRAIGKRVKSTPRRKSLRRVKGARRAAPPAAQIGDFTAFSEEVRAALPHLAGLEPGGEVLILARRVEPVDPNSELVNSAMSIIQPTSDKEASCRAHVASTIRLGRMTAPIRTGAKANKTLNKLMRDSRKTAKWLAELPAPLLEELLHGSADEFESNEVVDQGLRLHVSKQPRVVPRLERLRAELDSLANKINLRRSKKFGPKFDYAKINAAQGAYYTLLQFSPVRPTTTADGPFYELASVYYEAVTGLKDVNMDRQCRRFLSTPELR